MLSATSIPPIEHSPCSMVLPVPTVHHMILRPYLFEPTSCASYLFGRLSQSKLAVLDRHAELVDAYLAEAERWRTITAVFETHVPMSRGFRRSSRRPNGLLARGRWAVGSRTSR